jgi:hypothetical protein
MALFKPNHWFRLNAAADCSSDSAFRAPVGNRGVKAKNHGIFVTHAAKDA